MNQRTTPIADEGDGLVTLLFMSSHSYLKKIEELELKLKLRRVHAIEWLLRTLRASCEHLAHTKI